MRVAVQRAGQQDLGTFARMERGLEARDFVSQDAHEQHLARFDSPAVVYLRVLADGRLSGFSILVLEEDGVSVEFRRIVIATPDAGIGQQALPAMEGFCRATLGRRRVWLDVFEDNPRGRHVYGKLGYQAFDSGMLRGRPVLFLEKWME